MRACRNLEPAGYGPSCIFVCCFPCFSAVSALNSPSRPACRDRQQTQEVRPDIEKKCARVEVVDPQCGADQGRASHRGNAMIVRDERPRKTAHENRPRARRGRRWAVPVLSLEASSRDKARRESQDDRQDKNRDCKTHWSREVTRAVFPGVISTSPRKVTAMQLQWIVTLAVPTLMACASSSEPEGPPLTATRESAVLVDDVNGPGWPADLITLDSAAITADGRLRLFTRYGGGCADHHAALLVGRAFAESQPPMLRARVA